jgi:AbrB family looped-hinge helix DNA binding protein
VQIKLSSKGQVVLPLALRTKYHLKPGDYLGVRESDEGIALIPPKVRKRKGKVVKDPLTGLPCVTFGPGAPTVTKEIVDKLLEDFP